jgi:hypothetical protein
MSTALVLIALVALVAVVALAVFQFGLPNLPALTLPTAPTATLTLPTAAVLPSAAPETPAAEGTPAEPAVANCLPWDEVTLADTGKTLCVYGELKRWFAVDEIPFVALFSEERGSFAIVDRTTVHYEADPGVCIMATGRVEVMGGTRPYINANGELLTCR